MKTRILFFFVITLVVIFHYTIINLEEKILWASTDDIDKKPVCISDNSTEDSKTDYSVNCMGTPSGLMECTIMFIVMILMVHISYVTILFGIFILSIALIYNHYHKPNNYFQNIVGAVLGLLYATIYYHVSIRHRTKEHTLMLILTSILIFLCLMFMVSVKYVWLINNEDFPEWIEKSLESELYDRNVSIGDYFRIAFDSLKVPVMYNTWSNVETQCNKLFKQISLDKRIPDIIIGLKTGGDFIANYIGYMNNIPYVYMKLSKHAGTNQSKDNYEVSLKPDFSGLDITDLRNVHVLLTDTTLNDKETILYAVDYLTKIGVSEKNITVGTIMKPTKDTLKVYSNMKCPIYYASNYTGTNWPWS